jgi:hypothetical protein
MSGAMIFDEQQKFDARFGAALYAVMGAVAVIVLARGGESAGPALWSLAPGFLIIFVLFQLMTMSTRVDDDGVAIETLFFLKRRIGFSEIASAEATTYRPLRDFGGWGYRLGPGGKAFNMRGDRGVRLVLKNGDRVLIGSQQADELAALTAPRLTK